MKARFNSLLSQVTDVAVLVTNAASDSAPSAVTAASNHAVVQAQVANAASMLAPSPLMRPSDINTINKEGTKALKVVITKDNGEILMLAVLELQARQKQNKVWSKGITLVTVTQSPNSPVAPGPDCDNLTNIIKVPRLQMNAIVTTRCSDPGAQARSSDGYSMEHAINQFGILLTNSMDKDLLQAIEQDCSEHSQDGVLFWHIIIYLIFGSKKVLVRTLIATLRKTTHEGFPDVGLNYIDIIQELLRFGVGVDNVVDDQESMSHLLSAFQQHDDHLIQLKASEMSFAQLKEGSVETLTTLIDKIEPDLCSVNAHNKVLNMMTSPTPTTVIPGSPTKLSTTSTITVDDNKRIVAMFATMNKGLDARFNHIIKAISSITSGCNQIARNAN